MNFLDVLEYLKDKFKTHHLKIRPENVVINIYGDWKFKNFGITTTDFTDSNNRDRAVYEILNSSPSPYDSPELVLFKKKQS